LITANPTGLSVPTKSGNTPLHEACKCGASPLVIKLLIGNYPSAAYLRNSKGERPIDLARTNAAKIEVLNLLEKENLDR
jgi:ankyrin repeat protein